VAEAHTVKQAPLELGVVLVQAGQYEEAIPWLKEAQDVPTLDARASLFLGIAQLRVGTLASAQRNFERAELKDPSLRLPARYYRGIAAYQDGKWSDAERDFGYVAAYDPQSDMGREATTFLQRIRSGDYPRVQLYGAFGLQYDSNVVIAPSDDVIKEELDISNQADGRAVITAGGVYVPWRDDHTELSMAYEFYQSLHFQLTDFNLQDHRPAVQGVVTWDPLQVGLLSRYDYYLLETSSFMQEVSTLPWVAINETDFTRTEVFFRFRWHDFKQLTYQIRDAYNYEAGFRQLFTLGVPDRYLVVGYRYDHESPTEDAGNAFGYDGNEVDVGGGWSFPFGIAAELLYSYRYEDYAPASDGRKDHENQVLLTLYRPINEYLALTGGYLGDFNDSNNATFQYTRNIGSIGVEVQWH
jgi:tetratricopeptide (TPR) repeat protein